MLFCDGSLDAEQTALLDQLRKLDKRFVALLIQRTGAVPNAIPDADGEIARLFGAVPGTLYLVRPDLHIAGRWKTIVTHEVLQTARICLGARMP